MVALSTQLKICKEAQTIGEALTRLQKIDNIIDERQMVSIDNALRQFDIAECVKILKDL